jgi:hypothetical protein
LLLRCYSTSSESLLQELLHFGVLLLGDLLLGLSEGILRGLLSIWLGLSDTL